MLRPKFYQGAGGQIKQEAKRKMLPVFEQTLGFVQAFVVARIAVGRSLRQWLHCSCFQSSATAAALRADSHPKFIEAV